MSIGDVLLSFFSFFLTTWPIPSEYEGVYANLGNQATCEAQGFMVQLSATYSLYNAYLAAYFVLVVRYNWKERDIRKVEFLTHFLTFGFALGSAIAGSYMGLYNNYYNLLCWIAEHPPGCIEDPDVECERGEHAIFYQYTFYFMWIWGALVAITIMMLLLYWTVHQQSRAMRRYAGAGTNNDKRKRQVAEQAFLYIAAYYLMSLFPTLQVIIRSITGGGYFVVFIGNGFCFPLQGFFNLFIYLRPRYLQFKKNSPEATRLQAIRHILFNRGSSGRSSTSKLVRSSEQHRQSLASRRFPRCEMSSGMFSGGSSRQVVVAECAVENIKNKDEPPRAFDRTKDNVVDPPEEEESESPSVEIKAGADVSQMVVPAMPLPSPSTSPTSQGKMMSNPKAMLLMSALQSKGLPIDDDYDGSTQPRPVGCEEQVSSESPVPSSLPDMSGDDHPKGMYFM